MLKLSGCVKKIAINAALSAETKSHKKERIMDLYFAELISAGKAQTLIKELGLKHD